MALYRLIIVGAVLVAGKLVVVGVYGPALALALALATFAYIGYADPMLLR